MTEAKARSADTEQGSRSSRGVVVLYSPRGAAFTNTHERATRAEIARRLAALKGFDYVGEYDPGTRYKGRIYFTPSDTLIGSDAAALGIRNEDDLFGGVVPLPFVRTKVITHGLLEADAAAPAGWSHQFGRRVSEAVLGGFSVFTMSDAREAGTRLLERGPVRIKPVAETGGRGQTVVSGETELEAALASLSPAQISGDGLVLEENLDDVRTFSVGQVRVGKLVLAYYGTQRLTPDNGGAVVYGGSDLTVVRGELEVLLGLDLLDEIRLAVVQARLYDAAAMESFPGLFASRRNYDIARGRDCGGRWRCGVLEQSWRAGGASGAEIGALEAFRADPALTSVRAVTVELYGEIRAIPLEATLYFQGTDERIGPITKYTLLSDHAHEG